MNKYFKIAIVLLFLPILILAQNAVDNVLMQIERNNTTLSAERKRTDAVKIGNNTGLFLKNPEVQFNYLWDNSSTIGNRTDFSIKQSFDFPTAYGYKKQIAEIKNVQTVFEFQKQKRALLLQARNICIDLIYTNVLKLEYAKRLIHAESIAKSYQLRFDAGDANVLEYNKAQLNLLNLNNKMELLDIDRTALLSELARLNGGIIIEFEEHEFQSLSISNSFEQWYAQVEQNNPVLNWLKQEIEISKKQVSLNKAMNLPKIQAGYMSESLAGQKFKGISAGLSIPLWENKNSVKFAQANTTALEAVANDNKIQFYNQLKTLHAKVIALQKNVVVYRSQLKLFNNEELLKKALDKGGISLIDYVLELTIYYESANKSFELERELNKTNAELNQYF